MEEDVEAVVSSNIAAIDFPTLLINIRHDASCVSIRTSSSNWLAGNAQD
jgi:hypothetical protein